MSHLIEQVAAYYSLDPRDLVGHNRSKRLVRARHVCFYVMRKRFGLSYPQIGQIMHRDHSTVIYAVEKMWLDIETNMQIAAAVDAMMVAPCSRFTPAWLKKLPPKEWKSYKPTPAPKPVADYTETPQPRPTPDYTEAMPIARVLTCKPKNDFDTGLDGLSSEAVFRKGVRKGSDALLAALRAA